MSSIIITIRLKLNVINKSNSQSNTMLILKFEHVKMVRCKRGTFNDTMSMQFIQDRLKRKWTKKRKNCNLQERGVFYMCFVIQSMK